MIKLGATLAENGRFDHGCHHQNHHRNRAPTGEMKLKMSTYVYYLRPCNLFSFFLFKFKILCPNYVYVTIVFSNRAVRGFDIFHQMISKMDPSPISSNHFLLEINRNMIRSPVGSSKKHTHTHIHTPVP